MIFGLLRTALLLSSLMISLLACAEARGALAIIDFNYDFLPACQVDSPTRSILFCFLTKLQNPMQLSSATPVPTRVSNSL